MQKQVLPHADLTANALTTGCTGIGRLFGLVDLHQFVSQNALFRVIYKLRITPPKRPLVDIYICKLRVKPPSPDVNPQNALTEIESHTFESLFWEWSRSSQQIWKHQFYWAQTLQFAKKL